MTTEQKEELFFLSKKLNDANNALYVVRSELLNSNSSLNNKIISGTLSLIIDSIESVDKQLANLKGS